ncbi:DUF6602 domain-containing protein [Cognataquiflexum aquatile]|uniref:DUF6602 domain-containing protein n=1 Tax=Cognataquiflexum aquatile TaxID=2249427 RepID=UPI000DEAA79F|nr:DUF6602 domain-containing protein [Cognataquiflexum aquatile]
MASDIFNKILNRKLDTFRSVFMEDSESIFKIEDKLFHPQEFGVYRERVLSDLLKTIINESIDIKDGFIITSKNKVSTQSDLILFNKNNTPVINDGILRFFPIESVYAIGEVKSIIRSKSELKEVLIKLSNQKKLDNDLISQIKGEDSQLITFLVCKKIDYNFTENFNDIYENIENEYRHNFILSLEDGLIAYSFDREYLSEENKLIYDKSFTENENPLYWNPVSKGDLLKTVISRKTVEDEYLHIKIFLNGISSALNHIKRPRVELQEYYL